MIYANVDDMRKSEDKIFNYIINENINVCPYNIYLKSTYGSEETGYLYSYVERDSQFFEDEKYKNINITYRKKPLEVKSEKEVLRSLEKAMYVGITDNITRRNNKHKKDKRRLKFI